MADARPEDPARCPDEPLVVLRGVTRRYRNGTVALAGVDLTIRPGERIAVIGRSGSGKSTLLNVLGLLDVPTTGEVVLAGEHMETADDRTRSERRASHLGFVFQRSHLLPGLSVAENVLMGLRYAGTAPAGQDVVHDALRAVDLEQRSEAAAGTLSGGEMQRVAIARTLVRPARLWLADEPTGNLDEAQSAQIIEELKQRAAESGAALVVITHEPDVAARMDRVVTLRDGRVVADTGPVVPDVPPVVPVVRARSSRRLRAARTARFVLQGLRSSPRRTAAGTAAAAIAVALTVTALGLAQSASAQVTGFFDAQRARQVTARLVTEGPQPARWPIRLDTVAAFPGVVGTEHWHHHSEVPLVNGDVMSMTAEVVGVDQAPGATTESTITWAPLADKVLDDDEVVLGEVLAERLGTTQLELMPEISIAGQPVRVVGILEASRAGTAVGAAFTTTATAALAGESTTSTLFVSTSPGSARAVADRLPVLADPYGTTRMVLDPVLEADAFRGELQSGVGTSLQVLAVVASLAGLVGIVLVNLLAVGSRTAELGVRRALGARRSELVHLVVGECTVLALLGAVVGLVLGFTAIMTVTAVARWQPVFDPRLLLVPLAGAVAFGTVGGLPPAIAAGRIEPADAVRS